MHHTLIHEISHHIIELLTKKDLMKFGIIDEPSSDIEKYVDIISDAISMESGYNAEKT